MSAVKKNFRDKYAENWEKKWMSPKNNLSVEGINKLLNPSKKEEQRKLRCYKKLLRSGIDLDPYNDNYDYELGKD